MIFTNWNFVFSTKSTSTICHKSDVSRNATMFQNRGTKILNKRRNNFQHIHGQIKIQLFEHISNLKNAQFLSLRFTKMYFQCVADPQIALSYFENTFIFTLIFKFALHTLRWNTTNTTKFPSGLFLSHEYLDFGKINSSQEEQI